jgi:hypothetical protein
MTYEAESITPVILIPALIGEFSLCLWLLVKCVIMAKGNARVRMGQEI